jgi:DNA-binding NarL/FixJ family response regulator
VVGEVGTVEEALMVHHALSPDITLMDLNLKGRSGIEAIRQIRDESPQARFIVLSTFDLSEDIHRALAVGAMTYLLKDASRAEIIAAIEAVHAGEKPISPHIQQRLSERRARVELSAKEQEIVALLVRGKTNKEIGNDLNITELTVKGHLKNIFLKLRVSDRTEAAIKAVQEGIVHLNDNTRRS